MDISLALTDTPSAPAAIGPTGLLPYGGGEDFLMGSTRSLVSAVAKWSSNTGDTTNIFHVQKNGVNTGQSITLPASGTSAVFTFTPIAFGQGDGIRLFLDAGATGSFGAITLTLTLV